MELYCFAEVGPHLFTYRHILNETPPCTLTHKHTYTHTNTHTNTTCTLWQYECYTESSNTVFRAVTDSLGLLQSMAFINHTHTHTHTLREGEKKREKEQKI